jgi:hypothetical protein
VHALEVQAGLNIISAIHLSVAKILQATVRTIHANSGHNLPINRFRRWCCRAVIFLMKLLTEVIFVPNFMPTSGAYATQTKYRPFISADDPT